MSPDSLLGALRAIGEPLGSQTGMTALAALASLEISTAPLGTSTGGFTYTLDPLLNAYRRSASSFGPAFTERSLTTGKAKLSVGANWLYASYKSFDGQNLSNGDFRPARNLLGFAPQPAAPGRSELRLNMSSDTIVTYGHVGVTDTLDVGVAVPWVRVRMNATGTLIDTSGAPVATSKIPETSSSGVGDVAVFGKYRWWRQEQGGAAMAVELRLPTGDKDNLRGLGITRTLVAGIWSRGGTVSPHVNVGYEFWSAKTPISETGVFAKDQFKFGAGVELVVNPRTTVVIDVLGRGLRHGGSVGYQTFRGAGGTSAELLVALPAGITQTSVVPGIKWNVWKGVLITGNVLASVTGRGLRASVTPVIGLDWAF